MISKTKERVAALVGGVLLTGCASVPLSTMVKMATFDQEDLAALSVDEVRLRLTLDHDVPVAFENTRLELSAQYPDGKEQLFAGSVEQLAYDTLERDLGWFSEETTQLYRYELALDEAGKQALGNFQQALGSDEVSAAGLNVALDFADNFGQPFEVTMELQLSAQEGYFTLLDEALFEPDNYRD